MTYILKYTIKNMIVVIKRMFGWHVFFLLMKICDSIIMTKIIFVSKSIQFCEWLRIISLLLMILLKKDLSGTLELKWIFKIKTSNTNSSVCWYKLKIFKKTPIMNRPHFTKLFSLYISTFVRLVFLIPFLPAKFDRNIFYLQIHIYEMPNLNSK